MEQVLAWAVRAFFIVAALTPLALVVRYRWKDVNVRKRNIQQYVDAVKQHPNWERELAGSHLSDPRVTFADYHNVPRYVLPLTLLTLLMLASSYITYSWVCSHLDPVPAAAAARFPLVVIMALAGGMVWTLQQLMVRVYDGELGPPDLMEISVGLFAAVPIGFAFSLVTDEVNQLRSFAAFAASAFPVRESMRLIRQFTVRKMLEPGSTPVSRPAECHLGTAISGVSDAALARLAELRIVTAVDMAYSDPVKVMVQTGFPLPVIIDWMDQALWVLYAGDRKNELTRLGLRCALDVCEFVDMRLRDAAGTRTPTAELAAEDKAALAAVAAKLEADPALVADMFFRLCNDPQVRVLRLLWYQGRRPVELSDRK